MSYFCEGSLGRARRLSENKIFQRKNEIIDNFVSAIDSEPYFQSVASDKERIKEAFDILLSWFRDLMLVKIGAEESKLIHADRIRDLRKLEEKYTFSELDEAVGEIVKASKLLADNLNVKIALTLLKEKLWRK